MDEKEGAQRCKNEIYNNILDLPHQIHILLKNRLALGEPWTLYNRENIGNHKKPQYLKNKACRNGRGDYQTKRHDQDSYWITEERIAVRLMESKARDGARRTYCQVDDALKKNDGSQPRHRPGHVFTGPDRTLSTQVFI